MTIPTHFFFQCLLVHIHFGRLVLTIVLFVIIEYLLEFHFQFVNAVRHGNDGAVAVNEEQGTVLSAMLTEYIKLVVKVNETRPREGVTLDGLAHGIGGLEFVGKAEHVQTTIAVLVVDGDDVAGVADAGRAPRGPANDERQLILVVFRGADLLPVYCAHIVVVVLSSANLITHSLLLGNTLMHGVLRIERAVLAVVNVKHSASATATVSGTSRCCIGGGKCQA